MTHLDVFAVAWAKKCLLTPGPSLWQHGLFSNCCTNTMSILGLKLELFKGSLAELAKSKHSLRSFFGMTESKLKFKFSQLGPIGRVKSKDKH